MVTLECGNPSTRVYLLDIVLIKALIITQVTTFLGSVLMIYKFGMLGNERVQY